MDTTESNSAGLPPEGAQRPVKKSRRIRLLPFLIAILAAILLGKDWLLHEADIIGIVVSDSPDETMFLEMAMAETKPDYFLTRVWDSGKIPHRKLVAKFIHWRTFEKTELVHAITPIMREGALDADQSTRELMLNSMLTANHPDWYSMARLQLIDPDPAVRILGLDVIRRGKATKSIPDIARLLNDPDIHVLTRAGTTLSFLADRDFGMRGKNILQFVGMSPEQLFDAHRNFEAGLNETKAWWDKQLPVDRNILPYGEHAESQSRRSYGRLVFLDLKKRKISLSSFEGKPILINFWTIWCETCATEIPHLNELADRLQNRVIILGVSLDALPGSCSVKAHGDHEHGHENSENLADAVDAAIIKLNQAVEERKITYQILLDPAGANARHFNGTEIPTNILLGPDGKLLRRFHGMRNANGFESILRGLLPNYIVPDNVAQVQE